MTRRGSTGESYDDVPMSALLVAARRPYERAVRRGLRRMGMDDLPPTGSFLLTAMLWSDASLEAVIRWMAVSKQSVGQTVDGLVRRGYLRRTRDRVDRRRVNLSLTERGRKAGTAARSAIELVDRQLRDRVGVRELAASRTTLAALVDLGKAARTR
jgi:DNA-binding MarR family transcriptional regulator